MDFYFFRDFVEMFVDLKDLFIWRWNNLPAPTRILVALTVALGLLFIGTKSEKAGWSTILVMSSLGLLAYLIVLGYAIIY